MASPTTGSPSTARQAFQGKVRAMAAFKGGMLQSWEDTEIEALPAHLVRSNAVKLGPLDMEIAKRDLASLGSGLSKLTTGTLDRVTMGVTDKLLDEVGAGDLSETFKHRWVAMWRHPDLTRDQTYHLIWYESENAQQPIGTVELTRGAVTVSHPKRSRKGHSYTFELIVKDEEDGDDFHASFAAESFVEKVAWMNFLEDYNGEKEFVDSEDTQLHANLPKMHHLKYEQLPAEVLLPTALKYGYMHKQGKGGTQQFKKRLFVLWHHPNCPPSAKDGWAFLWYETEDSPAPKGYKLLKVGSYDATVEQDSKQNKKKKKFGDRFKLTVEDEEGQEKYVLATDNSLDLDAWVQMLMSQKDVNGKRASAMAAFGAGADQDEDLSYPKLLKQLPKIQLENYELPPLMRTEDELKESIEALKKKLADAKDLHAEAASGDVLDEDKAQRAKEQQANIAAQLQIYENMGRLSAEEKAAAQATAAAYDVLPDADVDASRERAYVAALACLLSGKMSDLDNVPNPPGQMTEAKCEMLRKAILTGTRKMRSAALVQATLQTHEELFVEACDAAKHLLDDLERQITTSTTLTESEKMRATFLQKNLAERPHYCANLVVRELRGVEFRPSSGWLKGTNPELAVVVRPLGAELDPEETVASTHPSMVNKSSGEIIWKDEELRFELPSKADGVQIQLMYKDSVLGQQFVKLSWNPAPHFADEELQIPFKISTDEMRRMEGVTAKVGRSLGQYASMAPTGDVKDALGAAREKAAAAKEKATAAAAAAREKRMNSPEMLEAKASMQQIVELLEQVTDQGTDQDKVMAANTSLAETAANASAELSKLFTEWIADCLSAADADKTQRTLMLLDALTSSGGVNFKVAAKRSCLALAEKATSFSEGDNAPFIQAIANKVVKKIQYVVGEKVEVYSASLAAWLDGTIIQVTATSVTAIYGDRKKDVDLADPGLANVIRPEKDPYADVVEDEPESEAEPEPELESEAGPESAPGTGLLLSTGDDDDSSEDEYDEATEAQDVVLEMDEAITSPAGLSRSISIAVDKTETVSAMTRRMSVQNNISPEQMAQLLGVNLDDQTTVGEASKKGKFAKGIRAKGGSLKSRAKAKKDKAAAKAKEKGAAAKAKAASKAQNARARAKGELTASDEVQLLIAFFASVGNKRQLDEDDVAAMIEGEGFEPLVARLEQQYHINPIEAWKTRDDTAVNDEDEMDDAQKRAMVDAHLSKVRPVLDKIRAALEAQAKAKALQERQPAAPDAPGPEKSDLVNATQTLLNALSITPDSQETVDGLELVASVDLNILSSICMSVVQQFADMERIKEKERVTPYIRSIARQNVEAGRKLIEHDGRAALKSLQIALQLDPKNPDAESLFGAAEAAILAEQAAAEEAEKLKKIEEAQEKVKELQVQRVEFLEELEAEKAAQKFLNKGTGDADDPDDDDLNDEDQAKLDGIDYLIAEAEVVVKNMKKAALTSKRGWIQVQGGRMEDKEGKLAERMAWKRRFAVLEDGVFSYYPNEVLSEEVSEELLVERRKQKEVSLDLQEGQEARWKVVVEEFDVGFQAFFSSESEDMDYEELHVKARKVEALPLDITAGQRARWNLSIAAFDVMAKVTFTTDSGTEMLVMDQETVGNPNNPRQGGKYAGSYEAAGDGTLTLYVDNSYSKVRGKHVKYFMYAMDPEMAIQSSAEDPIPEDLTQESLARDLGLQEDEGSEDKDDGSNADADGSAVVGEAGSPDDSGSDAARDSIRRSLANNDHADDEILAPYRIIGNPNNARQGGSTSGSFMADRDGKLILVFDNSYSKMRTKRLLYTLEEECPEDSDDEGSVDISTADDGEKIRKLDLSNCTDPPFCEPELNRIGIEMPDRTYMFECLDEKDYIDWEKHLVKTLGLFHGEEWLAKTEDEGDGEKVGEGKLHIAWQLHFRELLPKDETLEKWVDMGAAGEDEGAPTEPTWSLVGEGNKLYKVVCRELLQLEQHKDYVDPQNGTAIDWLCEELCLRVGIGDRQRTLVELRVALTSFSITVPCLSRVGRALKRSKTFVGDLEGPEQELYSSIERYVRANMLNLLQHYKISFPEEERTSESLLKAALECYEGVSDSWEEVAEALHCWPTRLLGALVGQQLVGIEDWSEVPFTAKILNSFCEIATPDLTLDDEHFRFLFSDEVAKSKSMSSMVDLVCEGYIDALEKAMIVVLATLDADAYSKGNMLYLYQAARDVFAIVEDISPHIAETLSQRIHNLTRAFAPVLDAHIERVSTQQEKWLDTSIRQDNSGTVAKADGTREDREPWQKLKPCTCRDECICSPVLHSVSVDDVFRMLFQVSRPLMQYWTPKYIAKVVRDAVVAYCERLQGQLVMEISSGDADDEHALGSMALGLTVGVGSDVANLGFGALTAISKGAGGVFTETYKGAKKGGALGLAKGLTKGVTGAVTTTVGTTIATARAATDLVEGVAQQAIDTTKALADEAEHMAKDAISGAEQKVNEFGAAVGLVSDEEEEAADDEEDKQFPDGFWVQMNNIHRACTQLDELGMDPAPLFGEMDDEDVEAVEEQLVQASSACRKTLNTVIRALMDRNASILMGIIADQVQPLAVWAKKNDNNPDAADRPDVTWDGCMDFCEYVLGEPHSHLYDDIFEKMLRELCMAWTRALEGILAATAESLPRLAIAEIADAVEHVNNQFWDMSIRGQFSERFLARATRDGSRLMETLVLHKKPTADIAQLVVDNDSGEHTEESYDDVQHRLAIGVLARRPDYMKVANEQVARSNGQVALSLFLAPPGQINLKTMPAKMLEGTAKLTGWIDKEVSIAGSTGNFRKRWLVLWRHQDDTEGNFALLWYEKEDSTKPKGTVILVPGRVTVSHPKNKRKGHENAFRMDVVMPDDEDSGDDEISEKQVISCAKYEDMVQWMKTISQYTTGKEEFERLMAEEEAERQALKEAEEAEEAERQRRAAEREAELLRAEKEAAAAAEAERIAQERAAENRRVAERLAAERKAEAERIEREQAEQAAEAERLRQQKAEELRLLKEEQEKAAAAAEAAGKEENKRAQKKMQEKLRQAAEDAAAAEAAAQKELEKQEQAKRDVEERRKLEEEQKRENEEREREEAERLKAQEDERARAVQEARDKAEHEAAEEEQQRLAEIARKEQLAAEAAKRKEMLAKIPEPGQMKLDATPCEIVLLSALCSGKLYKEGSQGKKAFKERFFVLWRHPNLVSGDYTLFWYESDTDQVPKGHQVLPVGSYEVGMPKKRRKGYDNCFRIDMKGTGEEEGRKFILAAQSEEKVKLWKDALAKIEADAPAEIAKQKAKLNLAKLRATGMAASMTTGSKAEADAEAAAAEREKALQDHITAGVIEAGIVRCVMATPAASLAPTAIRTGWLRKEGKGNKAFKRRFFVLWSTADALRKAGEGLEVKENPTPEDIVLVYYESHDSLTPKGYVKVEPGKLTAKKPKKKRKGAAHCLRVDQQGSTKDAQFKLVLGVENDDELKSWEGTLSRFGKLDI